MRTTLTIDEDVLKWVKIRAARTGVSDSAVIEEVHAWTCADWPRTCEHDDGRRHPAGSWPGSCVMPELIAMTFVGSYNDPGRGAVHRRLARVCRTPIIGSVTRAIGRKYVTHLQY